MVLRRIGVLSLGKVLGVLYAGLGLLFGGLFSLFSLLGAAIGATQDAGGAAFAFLFGVGAIVFMPLFYGLIGFIGGLLTALLYNVAAGITGGLELDLQ